MATINATITLRNDTYLNWERANPVLEDGELIIVRTADGINLKTGDGVSDYKALDFLIPFDSNLQTQIDEINSILETAGLMALLSVDEYQSLVVDGTDEIDKVYTIVNRG